MIQPKQKGFPSWVTFGRKFHKTLKFSGPICGNMDLGEDETTGQWAKVNCQACLDWRESHKYDRQKRWQAKQSD